MVLEVPAAEQFSLFIWLFIRLNQAKEKYKYRKSAIL